MTKRVALAGLSVALCAAMTSPAMATTIGQVPASSPPALCNGGPFDILEPAVSSGTGYAVPQYGETISSWSTFAAPSPAGQQLKFKVFRPTATPDFYRVIAHDSQTLTSGVLNTFHVTIPVKPGDLIGLNDGDASVTPNACSVGPSPDDIFDLAGDAPDNTDGGPFFAGDSGRLNVSAEVLPSNVFTFGKVHRNLKKGTATLGVNVPGPGQLVLSGSGVKGLSATASIAVSAPGIVNLTIRPTAKVRGKLNRRGKASAKANVAFTPTGGNRSALARKVSLRKRV